VGEKGSDGNLMVPIIAPTLSPGIAQQPSHVNTNKLNKKFGEVVHIQKLELPEKQIDTEEDEYLEKDLAQARTTLRLKKFFGQSLETDIFQERSLEKDSIPRDKMPLKKSSEEKFTIRRVYNREQKLSKLLGAIPPKIENSKYICDLFANHIKETEFYFAEKLESMKAILDAEQERQKFSEEQIALMRTLILKEVDQYCIDVITQLNILQTNILKIDTPEKGLDL